MRYLIAAAVMLIAIPAAAQQFDTARKLHPGSRVDCGFPAIPGLNLYGRLRYAIWQVPPGEDQSRSHLLAISPEGQAMLPGWATVRDDSLDFRAVDHARLEVDGVDIGASLEPDPYLAGMINGRGPLPPKHEVDWFIYWTSSPNPQKLVAEGTTLDLVMLDNQGAVFSRSRWDLATFRRIGTLLDRTGWSCTAPARAKSRA